MRGTALLLLVTVMLGCAAPTAQNGYATGTDLPAMGPEMEGARALPKEIKLSPPKLLNGPALTLELSSWQVAFVSARVIIGKDGHPRDPEIMYALASDRAKRGLIDEVTSHLLKRRYAAATMNGHPIAVDYTYSIKFGTAPESRELLKREIEAGAMEGVPGHQLAAAIVLGKGRVNAVAAAKAGLVEAQLWLGRVASRAEERLHWLDLAAQSESANAKVAYGLALLKQAEPPAEKIRTLLTKAAVADNEFFVRHALAELACSRKLGVRDATTAFKIAERMQLDGRSDPLTVEAVAQALAAGGDFGAAVRAQRLAVFIARELMWDVDEMTTRLEGYQRKQSCVSDIFAAAVVAPVPPRNLLRPPDRALSLEDH
jgi:hypothetical protein